MLTQVAAGRHKAAFTEHDGTARHLRNGVKLVSAVRDEVDNAGVHDHVVTKLAVTFTSARPLHGPPFRTREDESATCSWLVGDPHQLPPLTGS